MSDTHLSEELDLFRPHKGDIRTEYPELNEYEEFRDLTRHQILFVWYYGNPTSEFSDLEEGSEKIGKCIFKSYGNSFPERIKPKWLAGNFPTEIKDALIVMGNFMPGYRHMAKVTLEKSFRNLEKMLKKEPAEIEEMSVEDQQKYMRMVFSASKELPDLLKRLEQGFGVQTITKKAKDKDAGRSLLDVSHDQSN